MIINQRLNKKNPSEQLKKYISAKEFEMKDFIYMTRQRKQLKIKSEELKKIVKEPNVEYKPGQKLRYTRKSGDENVAQVSQDQKDVQKDSIKLKSDKNKSGFAIKRNNIIKVQSQAQTQNKTQKSAQTQKTVQNKINFKNETH
jgi:hypothetical protein